MYYVYVLKSKIANFYYKGFCEDLDFRLKQHNSGMTKSNKAYLPFEVAYFEKYDKLDEAIKREKFFKSASGRRFLKDKIN